MSKYKYTNLISLTILIVFSLLLSMAWPGYVKALGVSPALIEVDNVLNTSDIQRTVYFSRSNSEGIMVFKIIAEGGAGKYIYLPEETFSLPDGVAAGEYTFHIRPKTAANGEYKARVSFEPASIPEEGLAGQMNIGVFAGAAVTVKFTVSDKQVSNISLNTFNVDETEEDQPPFINFHVINEGNVDVRPDKIEIKVIDLSDPNYIISDTINAEAIEFTEPDSSKTVYVQMNKKIPVGKYTIQASFYYNDSIIFEDEKLLIVNPEGSLAQNLEFLSFSINDDIFNVNDLIKFTGTAENTGSAILSPVLFIELSRDGKMVEFLRSEDDKSLRSKDSKNYVITYRPDKKGSYEAEAYFEYGIKETSKKSQNFTVQGLVEAFGNEGGAGLINNIPIGLKEIIAIGVVLAMGLSVVGLVMAFVVIFKRRKKRSKMASAQISKSKPVVGNNSQQPATKSPAQTNTPAQPQTPQPPASGQSPSNNEK